MKRNRIVLLCVCLLALISACGSEADLESVGQNRALGDPHVDDDGASSSAGTTGAAGAAGMSGAFGSAAGEAGGSAGTGGMSSASFGTGGAAGTASSGDFDSSSEPPIAPAESGSDTPGEPSDGEPNPIQPGTLTAGAWDDNRNFDRFSEYRSDLLQSGNLAGALPTSDGDHVAAHELFSELGAARTQLDIALVIDTTGSMGDEIRYLQTELLAISQSISSTYPNAQTRWALVLYRDQGDAYLVQSHDFTSTLSDFRTDLSTARADGGGDTPEAPDAALAETNGLAWRTGDDVARLAFLVADAPHHDENAEAMADAILGAQDLGIHIYPVASSGVDELTELSMRSAAQLTGGRYLFLTDDSGVGGAHKEPTIPCYFVTKLDDAIVRMVDIEMSGEYHEPSEDEIIRTGGDPEDGACTLEGGEEVQVF
jgi:hypothetical protein